MYFLSVFIIGISGVAAQVVLLRELLVSFFGNELTLGLILANWVISEALGVFIFGRIIDRAKNKMSVFIRLQVIFSLALPVSIYLSRTVKTILGVPFGEAIGLSGIFYSTLFIIFLVGLCHGALFSCLCKIFSLQTKESSGSIGRIYVWETIGTIIGGVLLTYLLIPYLNSFQIALIISISNLAVCLFFLKSNPGIIRYTVLFSTFLLLYIASSGALNKIHNTSIKKQWGMQNLIDYRNSIYGNIAVVEKEKQRTFFYNGLPIIITPYPDITFVQEFANLPLLFHQHPSDVLVISAGAGGIINEILKHPVRRIDYAELDPLIIEMLRKHPSELTERELNSKKVNIINSDGRFFVKNTTRKYDVILIGLSKPSDLSANRVFTQEFFALIRERLGQGGILALYLPGSLTYLSAELRDLNACISNGLKSVYKYVRIIPGDYNIYLASACEDIMRVDADLITERIARDNIDADILAPAYLDYRFDKSRLNWFAGSSKGATKKINRDFTPVAVFQMMVLWNKQFSGFFSKHLKELGNLSLKGICAVIAVVSAVLFFISYYSRSLTGITIAYSVATTGFFAMLINLVLIFGFQIIYGYLYHKIGLLISIFMAGSAAGGILMTRYAQKIKDNLGVFFKLEFGIILFTFFAAIIITRISGYEGLSTPVFIILFFFSGLLIGLEFPLATKMCLKDKEKVGYTSGLIYFSDLMGGWVAGVIGAVVFLPVLGLFNTCIVIIFVKLSSLTLLGIFSKRLTP